MEWVLRYGIIGSGSHFDNANSIDVSKVNIMHEVFQPIDIKIQNGDWENFAWYLNCVTSN